MRQGVVFGFGCHANPQDRFLHKHGKTTDPCDPWSLGLTGSAYAPTHKLGIDALAGILASRMSLYSIAKVRPAPKVSSNRLPREKQYRP